LQEQALAQLWLTALLLDRGLVMKELEQVARELAWQILALGNPGEMRAQDLVKAQKMAVKALKVAEQKTVRKGMNSAKSRVLKRMAVVLTTPHAKPSRRSKR
jgi:hypothetical protein